MDVFWNNTIAGTSIITVILLLLHPASLMHKNPQRCKIIDCMHPIGHKDRSIGMKMFL